MSVPGIVVYHIECLSSAAIRVATWTNTMRNDFTTNDSWVPALRNSTCYPEPRFDYHRLLNMYERFNPLWANWVVIGEISSLNFVQKEFWFLLENARKIWIEWTGQCYRRVHASSWRTIVEFSTRYILIEKFKGTKTAIRDEIKIS